MSDPKFQHFVARMQVARFADADGWVHVWNPHAGRVLPQRPENVFGQNHLYSTTGEDGRRDAWLERRLGRLETDTAPLLRRIESAAGRDLAPRFDATEKRLLDRFFYTQWKRVPDFFEPTLSIEKGEELMDAVLAGLRAQLPQLRAKIDATDTPEVRSRLVREGRMRGLAADSPRMLGLFERRGLVVLRLADGTPGFILGSMPVVRTSASLEQDDGEVWLPITPRLLIGPGFEHGTVALCDYDPAELERFNRIVANQSTSFGGPDPSQVAELAEWRREHRASIAGRARESCGR
jgi:hypothetical protein